MGRCKAGGDTDASSWIENKGVFGYSGYAGQETASRTCLSSDCRQPAFCRMPLCPQTPVKSGAPGGTRTPDPLIRSQML